MTCHTRVNVFLKRPSQCGGILRAEIPVTALRPGCMDGRAAAFGCMKVVEPFNPNGAMAAVVVALSAPQFRVFCSLSGRAWRITICSPVRACILSTPIGLVRRCQRNIEPTQVTSRSASVWYFQTVRI